MPRVAQVWFHAWKKLLCTRCSPNVQCGMGAGNGGTQSSQLGRGAQGKHRFTSPYITMLSASSVHCLENSGQRDAFQMNHHLRIWQLRGDGPSLLSAPSRSLHLLTHGHVSSPREERRPTGGTCSLAGERLLWALHGLRPPACVGRPQLSVDFILQTWTLLYPLPSFTAETVHEWDKDYPISLPVSPKARIFSASNSLN